MTRFIISAVLVVTLVSGCHSGEKTGTAVAPGSASRTPHAIEASISEYCKTRVVRARFPTDQGHARFRALAEDAMLIRCKGKRRERSAYARFKSHAQLGTALGTILLPPGRVEQFCLTEREAFTTDFGGSVEPVCKKARGRIRNVRRPPNPSSVTHRTYVPNCGNTSFLEVRPRYWSNGCTGGSANMRSVTWHGWGWSTATGAGTAALRGPCDPDCTKAVLYRAPGRVRLDRPRQCNDQGAILRYFARARFEVLMRVRNPFGYPPGWHQTSYKAVEGSCQLTWEDPLSHLISG
jgi:hypothetical protein